MVGVGQVFSADALLTNRRHMFSWKLCLFLHYHQQQILGFYLHSLLVLQLCSIRSFSVSCDLTLHSELRISHPQNH